MFRRLGAEVVLAPVLTTVKLPHPDLLRRRTEEVIAAPPDYLIANTGVGMRTWMAAVEGWGLDRSLKAALAVTRIAARGPKAAGALSSAGLGVWWRGRSERLAEVADRLIDEGLEGRRVAFQLHGDDGAELVDRLARAGASVVTLPVYEWAAPDDPAPVRDLIELCRAGRVQAVTFTAGPQVVALIRAAAQAGMEAELRAAFTSGSVLAGCIGPVCASAATAAGLTDPVVPANWRLGSLVKAVAEALDRRRRPG